LQELDDAADLMFQALLQTDKDMIVLKERIAVLTERNAVLETEAAEAAARVPQP